MMDQLLKGLLDIMVKMGSVVLFLQPESVEWSIRLTEDAENELAGQESELNRPGKQIINKLLKELIEMSMKMWKVVLALQAETVEWPMKLVKDVKEELKDLGSERALAIEARVKDLDGQRLEAEERGGLVVPLVLRLQVAGNSTMT